MSALSLALLLAAAPSPAGLQVGDSVASFEPYHVSGPYAGTNQCPVCEWGLLPMVFVWVDSGRPAANLEAVSKLVEAEVASSKVPIKAFVVDANAANKDKDSIMALTQWSSAWATPHVYFMSRPTKLKKALKDYKLEGRKDWNLIVLTVKSRKVTAAFVDPNEAAMPAVQSAIRDLVKP